MRILITAIVTAIIITAGFLLTARYRPDWLVKLEYDLHGFPRIRKKGDKFIKNGSTYFFNGDIWVRLDENGFPIEPKPTEGFVFIKDGKSYTFTNGAWVVTGSGGGGNGQESRYESVLILNSEGYPVDRFGNINGQKYFCKGYESLEQYPKNSKYYPYYHCVASRGSF